MLSNALAYPLLGLLIVTMLLSFSRGSIVAAVVGVGVWLALVPLRLRTLAVLLPAVAGAALVTAWAFSQSALTDDRVALADREDAGIEFGLILLGDDRAAARRRRADRAPRARAPAAGAHAPHARQAGARLARRRAADRAGRRSRSATAASAARSPTAGTTSRSEQATPQQRSRAG